MSRSSFLKPKGIEAEDVLLELKELGPLGIPPSSPLSAACNPFATELVLKAFTDTPAVPSGARVKLYMHSSPFSSCIIEACYSQYSLCLQIAVTA